MERISRNHGWIFLLTRAYLQPHPLRVVPVNLPPSKNQSPKSSPTLSPSWPETSRVVDEARSEVQKLKDSARQEGSAAVNQIKSVAESDVRDAQETGQSLINNQKENLANRFSEYAKAIETDYPREKQPAELLDDLDSLARRKPELVFGGLFVVGFVAARFFKASRRQSPRERSTGLSTYAEEPNLSFGAGTQSQASPQPYPPVASAQQIGVP